MKSSRFAMFAVVAVAVLLLATACASGRSSDSSQSPDETTAPLSESSMFGDLDSPCGSGDAAGATDQGVTDTAINIGYGDDAGFAPSPGLNHQVSDAMVAMVDWCNEQGGINGRELVPTYYDAKVTDVNNVMTDACEKEFFLVGQGFALDASQEVVRRGCGMPSVAAFAVSPQFSNGPDVWVSSPVPADYTNVAAAKELADLFPAQVKKAAVIYGNFSATIDTKDKALSAYPSVGWNFLDCPQEYASSGEADWKPFAQKLKDCGAEVVYWFGNPYPHFENLLTATDQIGYHPVWYTDTGAYDQAFADWNVDGFADDVYLAASFLPFEEADQSPATQLYVDLVEASGGDASLLGAQAASSFLLWATAAKACGSDLTRTCMATELDGIHEWTGGGLHSPTNPGENIPGECAFLMKLEGTSFIRVAPEEPGTYSCDPSYAAKVTGPVVERGNLDANRISQL